MHLLVTMLVLFCCVAPAWALSISHLPEKRGLQIPKHDPATGAIIVCEVRRSGLEDWKAEKNSGPGGAGLCDVFAGLVEAAVLSNWSIPPSDAPAKTRVRVRVDAAGKPISAVLEQSSGKAVFDASCANAVLRTTSLPQVLGLEEFVVECRSPEKIQ